jgi:hypothetical protein
MINLVNDVLAVQGLMDYLQTPTGTGARHNPIVLD